MPSLHGGSLEFTLTVPLIYIRTGTVPFISIRTGMWQRKILLESGDWVMIHSPEVGL